MKTENEKLIESIQEQAKLFLLNSGEFYPFGSCIGIDGNLKPLGAYLKSDNPSSVELVNMIERHIEEGLIHGDYKLGVSAVDVTIKREGKVYDAIRIRFFTQMEKGMKYI